jgi:phenylacetate-CoA ligase
MEEDCSCNNSFQLMKVTSGRKSDVIHLPDGSTRTAIFVYGNLMRDIQGIRQYQVIQEKLDQFTVKIVKDNNFTNKTTECVKEIMKERVEHAEVDIVIVDEIPREKSGKFRPFKPLKT